jgi:hypothetical protein
MAIHNRKIVNPLILFLMGISIILLFTIYSCLPFERITKVSTDSYDNLTSTSCLVKGTIVDIGEEGIIQHGHCWSLNPNPTISNDKTERGTRDVIGEYSSDLINLTPNKKYYVKAYATDKDGEHYGREINFTTLNLPVPAAPSNLIAEPISKSQINLSWTNNADNAIGFSIERSPDGNTNWIEIKTVGADTITFQNMSLSSSTIYYYRVRAFNAQGNSNYSNIASATTFSDIPVPGAPTFLAADAESSSQITISWTDNSNNEEGFLIERSPDGLNWAEIGNVGTNIYNYQNTGLSPSTTYYYRVRAYNAGGESGYSNTANAKTFSEIMIPAGPTDLTASAISSSQINLSWTDNSDNEEGFKIERAGQSMNWREIDSVGVDTEDYIDEDLTPSVTYFYRVRAYNSEGYSDYSNPDDATTQTEVTIPDAPSDLMAEAISDSRINLTWTDNSTNEEGFRIERTRGDLVDPFEEIDVVGANETNYQDTGLLAATPYEYRMRAYNAGGPSVYSDPAGAVTFLCPTYILKDHIAGEVAPVNKSVRYGVVETDLTGENKCWITQNLGASNVAGGPTDDTEASAGWYWQFNRKQGYQHEGGIRTPSIAWITGIEESSNWAIENDPCTILLGRGWRIPTETEWTNTDRNGGWDTYIDAYASVLKVHSAGGLAENDGSIFDRGGGGGYWSNLQYDFTSGSVLVVNSWYSGVTMFPKAIGASIRCIKD